MATQKPAAAAPAPAPDAPPPTPAVAPITIRSAIAHRIHAGPGQKAPKAPRGGGSDFLDFIMVCGAMVMIGGGLYGLFTVKDIPKETLPIIASLLSFLCGSILGAYAGYRWGASDAMKKLSADGGAK